MSSTKKLEDKKAMPMYRIAWKSKLTNAHGHGAESFSHIQAISIAEVLNNKWDNLTHWAELIQPDTKGED